MLVKIDGGLWIYEDADEREEGMERRGNIRVVIGFYFICISLLMDVLLRTNGGLRIYVEVD